MNFASMLAGFLAAVAFTTYGLLAIMSNAFRDQGLAVALVFGTAISAMVCACKQRLAVLALLARAFRGPGALEWCSPKECTSFSAWLGSSWKFNTAGGLQEGLRVCGVGVAIRGTHGAQST